MKIIIIIMVSIFFFSSVSCLRSSVSTYRQPPARLLNRPACDFAVVSSRLPAIGVSFESLYSLRRTEGETRPIHPLGAALWSPTPPLTHYPHWP